MMNNTGGLHKEVDETIKLIDDIDEFGLENMDMEDYTYIKGLANQLNDYVDYMEMTINNLKEANKVEELCYYREKKSLLDDNIPMVEHRADKLLYILKEEEDNDERTLQYA